MPTDKEGKIIVTVRDSISFQQVEEFCRKNTLAICYRGQQDLYCYHIEVPAGEEERWVRVMRGIEWVASATVAKRQKPFGE